MTIRTRSQIYLSIATMILTATLAVPAAAQTACALRTRMFQGKLPRIGCPCHPAARSHVGSDPNNRHGSWYPARSPFFGPGNHRKPPELYRRGLGSLGGGQWR